MKHFYSRGFPFHRGRRLRNNKNICDLVTETNLSVKDLVMPYFLREDNDETKISNMPGLKRFSIDELIIELEEIATKESELIDMKLGHRLKSMILYLKDNNIYTTGCDE